MISQPARSWAAIMVLLVVSAGAPPGLAEVPAEEEIPKRYVEERYTTPDVIGLTATEIELFGEDTGLGGVSMDILPTETKLIIWVQDDYSSSIAYRVAFVADDGRGLGSAQHCGTWVGAVPSETVRVWVLPMLVPTPCLSGAEPATQGLVNMTATRWFL